MSVTRSAFPFEKNSAIIEYYYSPRITWNVYELVLFYHWTTRNLARFVYTRSRLMNINTIIPSLFLPQTKKRDIEAAYCSSIRTVYSRIISKTHDTDLLIVVVGVCFPSCTLMVMCTYRQNMSGDVFFVLMWYVYNQLHVRNYGL